VVRRENSGPLLLLLLLLLLLVLVLVLVLGWGSRRFAKMEKDLDMTLNRTASQRRESLRHED
jgi:flagellar biogenesis protein FliO